MDLTSGIKTSEAKVTAWSNLVGMLLVTLGLVDPLHLEDIMQQLSLIVGAVMTIIMSSVYIWGRVNLKGKTLEAETKKTLG